MIRPLTNQEPWLVQHYAVVQGLRLAPGYSGKDLCREMAERAPIFQIKIKDNHFVKADPIIRELPPSIKALDWAMDWVFDNPSENACDLAYGRDFVATRMTHALADGGYTILLSSSLGRPLRRPKRIYIYSFEEMFDDVYKRITSPCSLNLARDGFTVDLSYNTPRANPSIVAIDVRIPINQLACYDSKRRGLRKATEHSWAAMLAAGLIHNFRHTGVLDFSHSGMTTLVNTRQYIEKKLDRWSVGNAFSRVIPHAGPFSVDEPLEDIVGRLRKSMQKQLLDFEPLKVLRNTEPQKPRPPGAAMMLSSIGAYSFPPWVLEAKSREEVWDTELNDTSEWSIVVTHGTVDVGGRSEFALETQYNSGVVSASDGVIFHNICSKCLRKVTLDQTLRNVLVALEPQIKAAL
jgi:hypothetical protein